MGGSQEEVVKEFVREVCVSHLYKSKFMNYFKLT